MAGFKLTDLVTRVDQDKLLIPDFQRGFKWRGANTSPRAMDGSKARS